MDKACDKIGNEYRYIQYDDNHNVTLYYFVRQGSTVFCLNGKEEKGIALSAEVIIPMLDRFAAQYKMTAEEKALAWE